MPRSREACDAGPRCSIHHRKSRKALLSDQKVVLTRRSLHYATDSRVQQLCLPMHFQDDFAHEFEASCLPCLHAYRTMLLDFQVDDSDELQPDATDSDGEPSLQASARWQSCDSVHSSDARPVR